MQCRLPGRLQAVVPAGAQLGGGGVSLEIPAESGGFLVGRDREDRIRTR